MSSARSTLYGHKFCIYHLAIIVAAVVTVAIFKLNFENNVQWVSAEQAKTNNFVATSWINQLSVKVSAVAVAICGPISIASFNAFSADPTNTKSHFKKIKKSSVRQGLRRRRRHFWAHI